MDAPKVIFRNFRPTNNHPAATGQPELPYIYTPQENQIWVGPANSYHHELIQRTPELQESYSRWRGEQAPYLSRPDHVHGRLTWPDRTIYVYDEFKGTKRQEHGPALEAGLGGTLENKANENVDSEDLWLSFVTAALDVQDQGFNLEGVDHDELYPPRNQSDFYSHPVFYDATNRVVYKGARGQYHTDAIVQHPDLHARYHGFSIFDHPPDMYTGRINYPANELKWYEGPPTDAEKHEVATALGAQPWEPSPIDENDLWSDEPSPPIGSPSTADLHFSPIRHNESNTYASWSIEEPLETTFSRIWNRR